MSQISDVEFVNIWENSNSREEAAERCGVTGAAVGMRAQKLRDLGVKLKTFNRGRPKKEINVENFEKRLRNSPYLFVSSILYLTNNIKFFSCSGNGCVEPFSP